MNNSITKSKTITLGKRTRTYFKLFLLLLTIGYIAMPEICNAANIIIKQPKIKKKNPRIEQGGGSGQNAAFQNFNIEDLTIISSPVDGAKAAGMFDYLFTFPLSIQNNDIVKTVSIGFTAVYYDGKTAALNLIPNLNKETGLYAGTIRDRSFEIASGKGAELIISLTNIKGDSVIFEVNIKKEVDPSSTPTVTIQFKKTKPKPTTTTAPRPKPETTTLGEISALAAINVSSMNIFARLDINTIGEVSYLFEFEVDNKKNATIDYVNLSFIAEDINGKVEEISLSPKFNEKTGNYEAFFGTKKYPSEDSYDGFLITIANTKVDSVYFESVPEKIKKEKDSCNTKFKLKEVNSIESNQMGIYGVGFQFSFEEKSDLPKTVDMIVQITNCNGETKNLRVKLSQSNGIYAGGFAMPLNKECPWAITYGEVYATNPCGEMAWWALDFWNVKTDGAGTRSTTTSTKNGRPSLQ